MRTITLFGPKGGTGRTTAAVTLASGFLALGRAVLVLDASPYGGRTREGPSQTSPLLAWHAAMIASGVPAGRLTLAGGPSERDVADALAAATGSGADVALVDTGARPGPEAHRAMFLSDLVVAPFTGIAEAELVSGGVLDLMADPETVLGLATGLRGGARARAAARAAFHPEAGPLLRTELPTDELLANQALNGDLAAAIAELRAKQVDSKVAEADRPGPAQLRQAEAVWAAVLSLTLEVDWALAGLRLAAPVPVPRPTFAIDAHARCNA